MIEALCAVRPHIKNARLDKTNPHFKSKYASLAAVLEAIAPFADYGIAVNETTGYDAEGRFVLTTQLSHKGEKVVCVFPLPENLDSQKMGSALTYARRFSLSTLCGISGDSGDEFDDDGEATRGAKGSRKKAPPPKTVEPVHDAVEPSEKALDFIGQINKCTSKGDLEAWAKIPAIKSDLANKKLMPDVQAAIVREAYVGRLNELTTDLSGAV
jgi:hypothetical protein